MQNRSGFGIKNSLTYASLRYNCFGTKNKDREIYTFNDKYVGNFIRKAIKGGKIADFNRYFESNQCEELINTIKNF